MSSRSFRLLLAGLACTAAWARSSTARADDPVTAAPPAMTDVPAVTSPPAPEGAPCNDDISGAFETDERRASPHAPMAVTFGLESGFAYYTESGPFGTANGIGRALTAGPTIGLRASWEILRWLALDVRGGYTDNQGNDLVKGGALSTWSGLAAVRLTVPLRFVKPYVLGGGGVYSIDASGSTTELVSSTVGAFVFGTGALVRVGPHADVGVEYRFSHLQNETLSTNANADGGDPSTFEVFGQYRFGL